MGLLVAGCVMFGALLAVAFGAPPPGMHIDPKSPLAQWFSSLQTPTGGSCCDQSDGRVTDDVRPDKDGFEVRIDQKWDVDPPRWVHIPDRAILHVKNPLGKWVVFYVNTLRFSSWGGDEISGGLPEGSPGRVLCVVPPDMT